MAVPVPFRAIVYSAGNSRYSDSWIRVRLGLGSGLGLSSNRVP